MSLHDMVSLMAYQLPLEAYQVHSAPYPHPPYQYIPSY